MQTFMPRVGFEPTIAVFERAKHGHCYRTSMNMAGKFKEKDSWLIEGEYLCFWVFDEGFKC
jgi:hypothetical protein